MNDPLAPLSVFGGTGFILGNYRRMFPYPQTYLEERNERIPHCADSLYGISTVSNYAPLNGNLHIDIDTNLTHLMNVLPNVRGRFTFLSSWFIYAGGRPTNCVSGAQEGETGYPLGFYSATKGCAEQLIQSYVATAQAGLVKGPSSYQILRLSNVIGNDPRAGKQKNALEWLLSKVVAHEDVPLYEGDGYRDYLHVEDTCAAINLCLTKAPLNNIINIGRGESHKLEDLILYAIAKVGSRSKVVRVPVPAFHKIVQVEDFWMHTTKLRALGFVPKYSVYQSIDKVLDGLMRDRGDALAEDRA